MLLVKKNEWYYVSSKRGARTLFPLLFEGRKQNREQNIKDPPFAIYLYNIMFLYIYVFGYHILQCFW